MCLHCGKKWERRKTYRKTERMKYVLFTQNTSFFYFPRLKYPELINSQLMIHRVYIP